MPAAPIKIFLDQGADGASASSLSNVLAALKDLPGTVQLVSQERAVCSTLLRELIRTSNDSSKSSLSRFMALECLFYLSCVPDDKFREGELFSAVQLFNDSFSDTLDREAERLDSHQEMLLVLLLRCTGYSKLKAGDVLAQLCGGEELRLVNVLLSILQNTTYERAVIHTCFRFFYELSTPVSYFQSSENETMEAASVTTFQAKLASLLQILLEKKAFTAILLHLSARWQSSVQDLSHGLGTLGSLHGYATAEISEIQKVEILHWGVVLRYLCEMIQNIADFCDAPLSVKEFQQSFLLNHQHFLASVLIPFSMSSLFVYTQASTNTNHKDLASPYVKAPALVLKFLRFAFYKASVELTPELISSLFALTQFLRTHVKEIAQNRFTILSAAYFVVALCNINAAVIKTPQDLSSAFTGLAQEFVENSVSLSTPHEDDLSGYAFFHEFDEGPYRCDSNESVTVVSEIFRKKLWGDTDISTEAFMKLQEELEELEENLARLTLVGLCSEIISCAQVFLATTFFGNLPTLPPAMQAPETIPAKSLPPPKKKKHPEEFCCQITGKLMREPVVLKNGHHFELDALQAVVDDVGHVDPISGETFSDPIEVNAALMQRISAYKIGQSVKNAK